MKKIVFIFLFIVLIGSAYPLGEASHHGILLKDYHSITLFTQTTTMQNYDILKDIILLPEKNFSETNASQMIDRINSIDSYILERLREEGVQLKLFTGNLTDEPTAAYLKGKKPRGYSEDGPTWDTVPGIGGAKVVLAKIGHSEKGKGHGSVNLELHELAHSIDVVVFDSISENPMYLSIWEKESNKLFPGRTYFTTYPEEYFAEAFAMYFLSNETRQELQSTAPLTYELFMNLKKVDSPVKYSVLSTF
ncbi:anthrax toxin lethal factor-related metalloendopeptidase [Fredinandcohnia humi]